MTALGATVALAGALGGSAQADTTHAGPAVKAMKKQEGAGGYYVTLGKSATSLTTKTVITVPKTTCGKGFYSAAVAATYTEGTTDEGASVQLGLGCFGKVKAYGDAILSVGSASKDVSHPLKAGAKVTVTVTITNSATTVEIAYSKKDVVSLKGAGGKPSAVLLGALLTNPPKYAPIKFSSATLNNKALSKYKPARYEATNTAGKVVGIPSAITGKGKSFSLSY